MNIKEIIYRNKLVTELLGFGVYNGYEYAIVSRGTPPCAYVRLTKDHIYYGEDYDKIPVDCHCGLTYADSCIDVLPERSGWWIGWDYGHCCDYAGYMKSPEWSDIDTSHYKKWTSSEIFEEVKQVIEQLETSVQAVNLAHLNLVPVERSTFVSEKSIFVSPLNPEWSKQAGKSLKFITEILNQEKASDNRERKAMKYLSELGSLHLALACLENDFERENND